MYKTGPAFCYLLLKESVANDVKMRHCLLDQSVVNAPSTSGGVVCRPVSTLKADILNITYDCYSQNNNVEIAEL